MEKITTGRVLARAWELVRWNPAMALAAFVLLTGISVLLDEVAQNGGPRMTIVDSMASLIGQYAVTRQLIDGRWEPGSRPSILPLIGLQLLSTLAIGLGLVLLLIPGAILMVRWFPSVPVLMARNDGVIAALTESWEMTRGSGVALFGTICLIYAPIVACGFWLAWLGFSGEAEGGLVESLVSNLLITGGVLFGWYAAVAFCEVSAPPSDALEEVFA
ncbi:hypothetical protein E2493_16525 [Sphingomonas parva]|uniref:Glycerophosphoryl diester phosphodiesterase membrane domain-containing protein n=1 Tax=Sphingomonas parva TaxID=2555898 RepID=A0A4Y8ZPY8_9SPHN|nr:glycerophosphoryl diester phosphodiesterase membrane domain-containing protein [Sphingomonas parva]TFI57185.1 hypothetical protein E2493_16525 [Sphingomonas parva]